MFDMLQKPPFNLAGADLRWVEETFASLSDAEKIGQLFVIQNMGDDGRAGEAVRDLGIGGVTRFFSGDFASERAVIAKMQADAKIPLLVSADLEGSIMSLPFGTEVPNPLALAAIDDVDATREVTEIMAQEALAVGVNWSFTPVLDINAAFRSPIVATRGYGSDPEIIKRHAMAQLDVFQQSGLAATVKHWPGEGYDDRDQHLVTTVIPQTVADWRATAGALYGAAIERGVLAVMSAHIAFPAYVKQIDPDASIEAQHCPATLSAHLNQTLLRDELGFNGLVVSDATSMAGLTSHSARADHLPLLIENGCDVVLFSDAVSADVETLSMALTEGRLSHARLDAAVIRILGLKATLGLHHKRPAPPLPDRAQSAARVAPITAKAPTLVKDVQQLMPLDPTKHRNVYVYTSGLVSPLMGARELAFMDMLRGEGFEVTVHDPGRPGMRLWEKADVVLYVMAEETLLTRERIFMNWAGLTGFFGAAMERPWHDVPCALISFGYPYYLYDAPRMPCVINAYMAAETAQSAVLECVMGRADFAGVSPVDPFCGQDIARL